MAEIDITDLLTDPDFVDSMTLVTRYPQLSSLGENFIKESEMNSFGSIQPADYKTVQKLPEAMRVEAIYSFWFKGAIITSEDCRYSNVLIFRGQRYQVRQVADWTNWGQGWCEGMCVREVPSP